MRSAFPDIKFKYSAFKRRKYGEWWKRDNIGEVEGGGVREGELEEKGKGEEGDVELPVNCYRSIVAEHRE